MENIELFNVLKTLTRKEMSKASSYLSLFTPASKQCLELFEIIEQAYQEANYDWTGLDLSKEKLNQLLFGEDKESQKTRSIRSKLARYLKRYCRFIAFDREQEESNFLLDYFLERNSYDLFDGEYRKMCKSMENQAGMNILKQSYEIYDLQNSCCVQHQTRHRQPDYHHSFESFFDFSLIKRMNLYCQMLNRAIISSFIFQENFEKEMNGIFEFAEKRASIQLLTRLYWACSLMLKGEEKQYRILKNLLLENAKKLAIGDRRLFYTFMHTFCINTQKAAFIEESREDYFYRFKERLLHKGEFISIMHAKNLSTRIVLQTKHKTNPLNKEEAINSLKMIAKEIKPTYQKSTLQFHLGVLDFYMGDYQSAIKTLRKKTKYANEFFKFDARTILVRAYFLTDTDKFEKEVRNFRLALENKHNLSTEHQKEYYNFTTASNMLYKTKLIHSRKERKIELKKLEDFLENNKGKVKRWFVEQMKLLK